MLQRYALLAQDKGPRVNFMFEACKLQYRGFILPLPPVGKVGLHLLLCASRVAALLTYTICIYIEEKREPKQNYQHFSKQTELSARMELQGLPVD